MEYRVVFRPQARRDLNAIVDYIARDNRAAASKLGREVRAFCANLRYLPFRGKPRDDLEPGMRTLSYRGRVIVAYRIEGKRVRIVNIFYRGRDYEAILLRRRDETR
jgi:toxin ParE1/3/4